MHELVYGLEMLVIGCAVVFLTLLVLAFILMVFNKVFTPRENAEKEVTIAGKQAAATVSTAEKMPGVRPEVIAASMGALLFSLEGRQAARQLKINRISPSGQQRNMWAQAGRTRLLHLRQDFVLMRRGKFR